MTDVIEHEWMSGRVAMPTTPLMTPNVLDSSGSSFVGKAFQVALNAYHKARTVTLMDVANAPLAQRRKMKHTSRDRTPSHGSSGSDKSSNLELNESSTTSANTSEHSTVNVQSNSFQDMNTRKRSAPQTLNAMQINENTKKIKTAITEVKIDTNFDRNKLKLPIKSNYITTSINEKPLSNIISKSILTPNQVRPSFMVNGSVSSSNTYYSPRVPLNFNDNINHISRISNIHNPNVPYMYAPRSNITSSSVGYGRNLHMDPAVPMYGPSSSIVSSSIGHRQHLPINPAVTMYGPSSSIVSSSIGYGQNLPINPAVTMYRPSSSIISSSIGYGQNLPLNPTMYGTNIIPSTMYETSSNINYNNNLLTTYTNIYPHQSSSLQRPHQSSSLQRPIPGNYPYDFNSNVRQNDTITCQNDAVRNVVLNPPSGYVSSITLKKENQYNQLPLGEEPKLYETPSLCSAWISSTSSAASYSKANVNWVQDFQNNNLEIISASSITNVAPSTLHHR